MARIKEVSEQEIKPIRENNAAENGQEGAGPDPIDSIEETKELAEDLFEKTQAFVRTSLELYKLRMTDKLAIVLASLVSRIIIIILVLLVFVMVNIGLAIWIGDELGRTYDGFFIIAGLYALIALTVYIFRDPLIKNPIINSIISQILK